VPPGVATTRRTGLATGTPLVAAVAIAAQAGMELTSWCNASHLWARFPPPSTSEWWCSVMRAGHREWWCSVMHSTVYMMPTFSINFL